MKVIKNILLLLIIVFITADSLAYAQDASETPISDTEVKEKIKEKLEQVIDSSLENVRGAIEDKLNEKNYGLAGTVLNVGKGILYINVFSEEKEVQIASTAAILKVMPGKGRTAVNLEDIATNDYLLAMGSMQNNILTAKRLVISPEPAPQPQRKFIHGKVSEADGQKITVEGSEKNTINVGKKTELAINGQVKPEAEDILIGDQIYALVVLDDDGEIIETNDILVIPGAANPAAEENEIIESTPSAID